MFGPLLAALSAEVTDTRDRLARLLIGLVIGLAALVMVLVALVNALFLVVALYHGPLVGYLAVAGVALIVAVGAFFYAFNQPRKVSLQERAAAVSSQMSAAVADEAQARALDAAKAVGESVRAAGETVADAVGSATATLKTRKGLFNATVGALVAGILLGRRF